MRGGGGSQQISSSAQPGNSWIPADILEISLIVPPSDRKRIPPWANSKLKYIYNLGKLFRSEQGVNPGSEPQNYDDNLRKQKFLLQCKKKFHITTQIVLLCGTDPAPGIKCLKGSSAKV
jgi:hypothetical protein